MGKAKKLTNDDIRRLAKLANLDINDKELSAYSKQLSDSLQYVENLKEIDTANVSETFFTTKVKNIWQDDEIDPEVTLPQKEVLKNANKTKKGYFIVKRIL